MAWHGLLNQFERHETASDPGLFLRQERLAADEGTFLEADGPIRIGFEWRRVFTHVVAIEQIAHFQPEKISCAKPCRFETPGLSLVDEQVPEAADLVCVDINLKSQLTTVACSGEQAGQAANRPLTGVMELEPFESRSPETHE